METADHALGTDVVGRDGLVDDGVESRPRRDGPLFA